MLNTKPIALLVNETMPKNSKNSVKRQKENQNYILNYENSRVEAKKKTRAIPLKRFFCSLAFILL